MHALSLKLNVYLYLIQCVFWSRALARHQHCHPGMIKRVQSKNYALAKTRDAMISLTGYQTGLLI